MVPASETGASGLLANGRAALADGNWTTARAAFEGALARDESAEAAEGLSWASWWLDDAEVVFAARERAYRLYRGRGDNAGAALMATWLAADQLDFRGAAAVAAGWLQRAERLLDQVEPGPEHGWLAFHQGYIAHVSGDLATAQRLGAGVAEAGRRFDVPDLDMLGLALQGAVMVARADVAEGMRHLDEAAATALSGEARIPISGAWVCCFLVTACTAVRDFDRAVEWCDRIAEFAGRYGSRYMLAFCRAEYGAIYVWRGRWADADEMLQASVDDFSRSRPAMVGGSLVGLAELRRKQGRADEASLLLDRAGPAASAQLCRARLAMDEGAAARAAGLAERLLRQASSERRVDRVPVLEELIHARVARGELDEARAALGALREIGAAVGTEPLRASVELAEGLVEAAAGEHQRARPLLEDAVDRFERSGAPFEAARARIELATSLAAQGLAEEAKREAGTAREQLLALGANTEAARAQRLLRGSDAAMPRVTKRERDVLPLLAQGLTNRQIAERLVVSEHTVHRHVTNILRKLELPSRAAAAAHAVRSGMLDDASE